MRAATELQRDLVLVGGGHAHVLALRTLAMQPLGGLRITLVSPSSHTPYSGMLPGLIAGHYSFEQVHIDLARLCQWAGARFVAGEVTGLDPRGRRLSLAGRPAIDYDLVSLDIGSRPELDSVPGARTYATPVKPIAELWQHWQDLRGRISGRRVGGDHRIAIVGGGAGSVELALAVAWCLRDEPVALDLWCAAPQIIQRYNARARRAVMSALRARNIRVHVDARVTSVEQSGLVLSGGERAAYDELFWCTDAAAAPWVAESGLATDARGFLAVRDTLQSLQDDQVFGSGDIATLVADPSPKAGVYAVRQGPVLAHNLRALLLDKPLRRFRPQRRFLSIISLGDKCATADRGPFSATGAWVWHWKDRIDRAFMDRFAALPAIMSREPVDTLSDAEGDTSQPACGGCGAKVGADVLGNVLRRLSREYPQHCICDGDDATALPVAGGVPVVQSIDVLRQLVSDPWLMGRIAANHALSDLYACGARPVTALAAITLPFANSALLQRELQQLLAGAVHECAAVDCQLRGGHSMQGEELSVGFVVNGTPWSPDGVLLAKTGAAPGDRLVLTKPLGTGVLFAAYMQLAADGRDVSGAIASMLQSNGAAAQLALAHGASACTDITGFGLLGHLLEMLGSGLGARLELQQLPLLQGALEHLQAGIVSTMHASNRRSAGDSLQYKQMVDPVDQARLQALFDPQTSGGLLIAVPAQRATALAEALQQRGYDRTRIIGEITPPEAGMNRSVTVC